MMTNKNLSETGISKDRVYSQEEEWLNVLTHGFGLLLAIFGVVFLFIKAFHTNSMLVIFSVTVYSIGLITMFLSSTLYHSSRGIILRRRLNIFDHVSIYLSIAGAYTPLTLLVIPRTWGIPIFLIVWSIAIVGTIVKFFFIGRFSKLSTSIYVLMGWVIIVALKPLIQSMETAGLIWLLAGGIFYTVGAVFYQIRRLNYNHAIFHLFVLLGSASHYVVVYCFTFG